MTVPIEEIALISTPAYVKLASLESTAVKV